MTTASARSHDEYLKLVRRFPPRPIHTAAGYARAVEVMNRLAIRDEATLSRAEADYLEALAMFVEAYDRAKIVKDMPRRGPLHRIKHLMEQAGMTPADLGRLLHSSGLATEILQGRRQLSKTHIRILADRFAVNPGLFLD